MNYFVKKVGLNMPNIPNLPNKSNITNQPNMPNICFICPLSSFVCIWVAFGIGSRASIGSKL